MTAEPPVIEDRRRLADRRQVDAFAEDESHVLRLAAAAGVAICGGLVVVYAFFVAIGEVDLGAAAAATITVLGFACIWCAGYWWRHRSSGPRGPQPHERERRGF
jgi:hypothetical protein